MSIPCAIDVQLTKDELEAHIHTLKTANFCGIETLYVPNLIEIFEKAVIATLIDTEKPFSEDVKTVPFHQHLRGIAHRYYTTRGTPYRVKSIVGQIGVIRN